MAIEEMFTELPTVSNSLLTDIICAVQGYSSPSVLGLSTQQTLSQVFSLFQSNIILFNSGDPNGSVAGSTYQFCWDTLHYTLYLCVTSGTTTTAVWVRADINDGYTTTVTSAGTTTLTILSTYWQFFTGSTTHTVVMPVASTLKAGMSFTIVNNSSGAVTVQSSGLNTITTLAAGQTAILTCILNSGTSAASWHASIAAVGGGVTSITGTANQIIASASTGAVTLSTPQDIATTSNPTFASLTLTNPLTVPNGGTGLATLTANGILFASGTTTVGQISPVNSAVLVTNSSGVPSLTSTMTNGQIVIGSTGGTPAAAAITAGSGITVTNGANTITIAATGGSGSPLTTKGDLYTFSTVNTRLAVGTIDGQILQVSAAAATGLAYSTATYPPTTTINQLLYSSAANTVAGLATTNSAVLATTSAGVPTWLGSLTNGQVIIGSTGATPVAATLTAGAGISISTGAGSITISGTGSGIGWTEVSGTTQAMAADNGYVSSNAGLVTFTLPVTAAFGTVLNVVGKGAGGWKINQNSGQNVQTGSSSTTVGVGGSLASSNRFDSIELLCTTANTTWTALGGPQSAGLTVV